MASRSVLVYDEKLNGIGKDVALSVDDSICRRKSNICVTYNLNK